MSNDQTDTSGKMRQYKMWFLADREHCRKFHKAAKEDFEFRDGKQWTDTEEKILKDQLRPIITFNRTNPIIQAISGMEISNRKEVKYFPREEGDAKSDELLTDGAKWFRDVANADSEDSDAFQDAIVCGLGCTETTLNFDEDEAGLPDMTVINPLEILWDKSARKKNLTDARRRWRVRSIPRVIAQDMFVGTDKMMLDASWAKMDSSDNVESQDETNRYQGEGDQTPDDENDVTIVQLQYEKRLKVTTIIDMQTGEKTEIPSEQLSTLLDRSVALGKSYMKAGTKTVKKVMNVFLGAEILGKETEALGGSNFSFNFITAYIDRITGMPYGLMRLMKDPQKWANKWMSQSLHILNTNAKGGVMYEEGAIDNIREFEKTWARNDKMSKVRSGALASGQIREKAISPMPAGFFQMMEFAISSVRDVTGISLELLGNRNATQAASLEFQRRQAGMSLLAPLFDNLKRYREEHGKLMLYIIQNYLADGRLVRIVGDANAKYVPLALKADLEYDIIVDDQVNSPDMKLMVWRLLQPLLPTLPPQIQLALLDYSPLPPTVIEKIKEAAKGLGPSDLQKQMEQLQVAKSEADIEEVKSQAMMNVAKAQELGGGGDHAKELGLMKSVQDGALKRENMAMQDQHFQDKLAVDASQTGNKMTQDAALAIVRAGIDAETKMMTKGPNNG